MLPRPRRGEPSAAPPPPHSRGDYLDSMHGQLPAKDELPHAFLAHVAVAVERRDGTHQPIVVKRLHDRRASSRGFVSRRRDQRERVVKMDDLGAMPATSQFADTTLGSRSSCAKAIRPIESTASL